MQTGKYFILRGTMPVEVNSDKYYKWRKKPSSKIYDKCHEFIEFTDKVRLEFLGAPGHGREYDEKPFRVSYRFDTGYEEGWCDRVIDEDYATYEWALERFHDFVKNGRKTTIVFKKEFKAGEKLKK